MWELAVLALGKAAGPLLNKAAERHVERFFGDRLDQLGRLGKKAATVTAMERAWTACVVLILREVRYLGDYQDEDHHLGKTAAVLFLTPGDGDD